MAVLAFVAVVAAMSASRHKDSARKWQERAVRDAENDVQHGTDTARAALTQAKLHAAKAKDAEEQTRKKLDEINKHDPTMADITSRWHKPRKLRNDAKS